MKSKKIYRTMGWTALLLLSIVLGGCHDNETAAPSDSYTFVQPANFPPAAYTFENNPVTQNGFELGRMLFYDPILSADSTIACASCHQQVRSFADPVHRFSKGVGDVSGTRNAPAIQNMAFQKLFFWDGGVKHLDFVPINAITSELEMHETVAHVVTKLQRNPAYAARFEKAFGSTEITSQKMLYALSQFMCLMVSANSRYDQYIRGEGEQLTADELAGLNLFQAKCASCHSTDLFTDGSFRNNGLNATFERDSGRQHITESAADRGKFKVPSLRNVELSYPYMHDGRFKTLESVLAHYQQAVQDSETLDPLLKNNGVLGIAMTDDEKSKIVAFLKTLTDKTFIQDKRFSAPILN